MGRAPVDDTAFCPWDRQIDEPSRWYDRFERGRLMGPGRSLLAIYRAERTEKGRLGPKPPTRAPSCWARAAERWDWHGRWRAWDDAEVERRRQEHAAEQQRIEAEERERAAAARRGRISGADAVVVAAAQSARRLAEKSSAAHVVEREGGERVRVPAGLAAEDILALTRLAAALATAGKEQRLDYGEATERIEEKPGIIVEMD